MAETIKVELNLELHEEDLVRTMELATKHGMGFQQMLEGFLADLSGGERRNGSDESEMAYSWFERAYTYPEQPQTFLMFLMNERMYDAEEIAKALWFIEDCYDQLADAECKEDSDEITDDLEGSLLELEELYTEYKEAWDTEQDMADALKSVYDFYCNMELLKGRRPMFQVQDTFWDMFLKVGDEVCE